VVQGTDAPKGAKYGGVGDRSTQKYGGVGDRSIFGHANMVAQGTGQLKIWWRRGQVSSKYGGAGDRSAQNMVAQGTDAPKGAKYGGVGDRSTQKYGGAGDRSK
jgi:hypothetical protein